MTAPSVYVPDSAYAWRRLAVAFTASMIIGVGMWAPVVVLPYAQADFGVDRAGISAAYTAMMLGFAAGTVGVGVLSDRIGAALSYAVSAFAVGLGFAFAGFAPNAPLFALAHGLLIGLGAAVGFGPTLADVSHWFVVRRGLAVAIAACGNYVAGAIWPLVMNAAIPHLGWRGTYMALGAFVAATVPLLALAMRRRPEAATYAAAAAQAAKTRASLGLSPRALTTLLCVAGFACCAAMAMPQVHIVAYCGDLGYGPARGAEMLSLMLALGVISRLASGKIADGIGGAAMLVVGSFGQGLALSLFLLFDGLTALYALSGFFGLAQGGIVPMYAVIARETLPPETAGARIGIIIGATVFGMAFGGMVSGFISDFAHSYAPAFAAGVGWNLLNFALAFWLYRRMSRPSARFDGLATPEYRV